MSRYLYQLIYKRDLGIRRPGVEVMARERMLNGSAQPEIDLKLLRFREADAGNSCLRRL